MARGIMVVASSPASADEEAEYNEWYTQTHIPQLCAIPGFLGARRYKLRGTDAAPRYLAIYDLEADDLDEPLAELRARSGDGRVSPPRGLQLDPPPVVSVYEVAD